MPSEPTFASSAVLPTSSPAALSTDSISLNPNPLVRALLEARAAGARGWG